MELPLEVLIHSELVGFKGREGVLLAISELGFFEITTLFGDTLHRLLVPIQSTVLISKAPEDDYQTSLEVEP